MQLCARLLVLSSIGLFGLASVLAIEQKKQENQEIKGIWQEIFRGTKTPDEFYEHLKRIQQVYASLDENALTYSEEKRKLLHDLLYKIWSPTRDECTYSYFTLEDNLDRYLLLTVNNIDKYWDLCQRKRVQICEPVLEEQLKAEVDDKIDDESTRKNLRLLVESIAGVQREDSGEDPGTKGQIYVAGILRYLEALEGPLSKSVLKDKSKARDRFTGLYKRLVEEPCDVALLTGQQQLQVFNRIQRRNKEWWTPTGLVKEWLDANDVCLEIVYGLFADSTFELLQESSRNKGILGKLGIRRKKSTAL